MSRNRIPFRRWYTNGGAARLKSVFRKRSFPFVAVIRGACISSQSHQTNLFPHRNRARSDCLRKAEAIRYKWVSVSCKGDCLAFATQSSKSACDVDFAIKVISAKPSPLISAALPVYSPGPSAMMCSGVIMPVIA